MWRRVRYKKPRKLRKGQNKKALKIRGQLGGSVDWKPGPEMGGPGFKCGLRHFLAM